MGLGVTVREFGFGSGFLIYVKGEEGGVCGIFAVYLGWGGWERGRVVLRV